MRLLERSGSGQSCFRLVEFPHSKTPPYAILSHTWGDEEVTFGDIADGTATRKLGYEKIRFCGEQADRDGFQYFWVDTCCIDKSSSAELQESINSMFAWYRDAAVCYVFLSDVTLAASEGRPAPSSWEGAFRSSRWFTRGWTLQELIAPKAVEFFSRDGVHLGSRTSLEQCIHETTGIPTAVLRGTQDLSQLAVAERMAWIQGRETTREEDTAYSLLGIFSVHMPLIYSEGKDNAFRRLKEEIEKKMPPQPSVSIPFPRDPDFVSRGSILDQVDQLCSEPAGRVALVGLGGVGKSQLAIEFAHRIAQSRRDVWIFWIYAGTQGRVEEGFRTIAETVKLVGASDPKADIPLLVQNWLSNERNGRWIVVLDSADDREALYGAGEHGESRRPLASFLPQSRNGAVIVTTRNKDLAFKLTGSHRKMIEVGPMTPDDAITLLEKKLGTLSDAGAAIDLVNALDCVPLAIGQAAAYIQARQPRSSVEKYLADFRESERKRTRLLDHDAGDLRRDGGASNAILSTWQMSFDCVVRERPSAADLLSLMSFFDCQGIPESALQPPQKTKSPRPAGPLDAAGSAVEPGMDSSTNSNADDDDDDTEGEFEDDVAMLRNYCLVGVVDDEKEFEMHKLVQLSTRRWLRVHGQEAEFQDRYIRRLEAVFPEETYENWGICQKLFAHVQLALDYKPGENSTEAWESLICRGGRYAWLQGKYAIAEQMVGKAWRFGVNKRGRDDHDTLVAALIFAVIIGDQGRWREAEKLLVHVVDNCKKTVGEDHRHTLVAMANLASIYKGQGLWDEAEKLLVRAVAGCKKNFGAADSNTLTSMCELALVYKKQGRWKEAEELQVQLVETYSVKFGVEHPQTWSSMGNLASTIGFLGRWLEAEELQIRVMNSLQGKLGAYHPATLTSMANLAQTYGNQGRWEEAERLERRVVEGCTNTLGADHPGTLKGIVKLVTTLRQLCHLEEAEALIVPVIIRHQSKLGAEHPSTLVSMSELAGIYREQGRYNEAKTLLVHVVEALTAKMGADHPQTLTGMSNLASFYKDQQRWGEAEKLEVQVMETKCNKLGAEHPATLLTMNNIAFTLRGQGRYDDALQLMARCVQARRRVIGPEHPHTLSSLEALRAWGGRDPAD